MEPLDLGIVTGRGTWPALLALLERPGRKVIASAFIGSDGATLLRTMGRGDLLVCNASDAALKQGSTNPSALRALTRRGVTVRSIRDLHAKVYIVGDRAFVGSPNVSGTSTNLQEVGIFLDDPAQVGALRRWVEVLGTSAEADRVDATFLDLADRTFRPARSTLGRRPATPQGSGARLWFWGFGGDNPPAAVEAAATKQRVEYGFPGTDAAASYEWSWGTKGAWKPGDRCVWIEREGEDTDSWWAQPPSECLAAYALGGRSQQWIYWWRTPNVDDAPWGQLRAHVLTSTGRSLRPDRSTRDDAVAREVDRFFGLGLLLQ